MKINHFIVLWCFIAKGLNWRSSFQKKKKNRNFISARQIIASLTPAWTHRAAPHAHGADWSATAPHPPPSNLHGSARDLRNNDLKLSFSSSQPLPPRLHPDTEGAHPSQQDKDREREDAGGRGERATSLRQTAARPYGGGEGGYHAQSGITVTPCTPRKARHRAHSGGGSRGVHVHACGWRERRRLQEAPCGRCWKGSPWTHTHQGWQGSDLQGFFFRFCFFAITLNWKERPTMEKSEEKDGGAGTWGVSGVGVERGGPPELCAPHTFQLASEAQEHGQSGPSPSLP